MVIVVTGFKRNPIVCLGTGVEVVWEIQRPCVGVEGQGGRRRQTSVARARVVVDTEPVAGDTMAVGAVGAGVGGGRAGCFGRVVAGLNVWVIIVVVTKLFLLYYAGTQFLCGVTWPGLTAARRALIHVRWKFASQLICIRKIAVRPVMALPIVASLWKIKLVRCRI